MKNTWLLAILLLILLGCKSKCTTLADDQAVTPEEFIEFFPEMKLPFNITDTASLFKKNNDSSLVGYKVFTQMVGDTVLSKQFISKTRPPRIFPIGRVPVKKGETYIFIKVIAPAKRGVYVLTFDKKDVFKAALPLVVIDNDPQTTQSAEMDNRHTITTMRRRKKADGTATYRKDVYVFNDLGQYTLILTESNEALAATAEVVNPLDTFSRRHKYAGDYVKDKRNIVSVREGKNGSHIRFFIHFEKDKGACKGELRGEANFVQPTVAVFRQSGDPCVLQFTFTSGSVTLKELEGCGNYRDIRCFFEGSFPKKKEPAKPKKK